LACVYQLEKGEYRVENRYQRCVEEHGNRHAQTCMQHVFTIVDREWRGIGVIPSSGLALNEAYRDYDATRRFPMNCPEGGADGGCISGLVLQGKKRPVECPFFGAQCTPEKPMGAPMVSPEGACSAYFYYATRRDPCH
jgi:hydrogenase expression/formation protein HypD